MAASFSGPRAGRTGRALPEELLQGDVQAIRHEGDEDMRLDALLVLMKGRLDREVPLQILERRLDLGLLQVELPELRRIGTAKFERNRYRALLRRTFLRAARSREVRSTRLSRSPSAAPGKASLTSARVRAASRAAAPTFISKVE